MKYQKIKDIKNNFTCFNCHNDFYYSPYFISKNLFCDYCKSNKKISLWKLLVAKLLRKENYESR